VNVFLVSLTLFGLYLIISMVTALLLSAASMSLHPATRLFIWLVLSAAVGYNLLRRYRRYPSLKSLALILALAIGMLLAMSIAAMLRLAEAGGGLGPEIASFALNAVVSLVSGRAGCSSPVCSSAA
jgi:hypothetical protein